MKNFAKYVLLAAFLAAPALSFAQSDAKKSNEELSAQYKYEIDALQAELKANKKHQKALKSRPRRPSLLPSRRRKRL